MKPPNLEEFITNPVVLDLILNNGGVRPGDWVLLSSDPSTNLIKYYSPTQGRVQVAEAPAPTQVPNYICTIDGTGEQNRFWLQRYCIAGWIRKDPE